MKKNVQDLIILVSFTLILFGILTHSSLIIENIKEVTQIWLFKLFPSLFPFLVIGSILINYNFGYYLCKLFKLKSNEIIIFILAMLSGFPSNAKYTKEMYLNGQINKESANNVLCYSFLANPLFLLTILANTFSQKITIYIILSHYLANGILGLGFKKTKSNIVKFNNNKSLGSIISQSIKDAINTLLLILGTITFYNIFITLLNSIIKTPILKCFLTGFLEFSQGLNSLAYITSPLYLKSLMAIFFISFGSLSILTQIKSIINDTDLNYSKFVKFRFLHVIVASFIYTLLYLL